MFNVSVTCVALLISDRKNLREEGSFGVTVSKGSIHYVGESIKEWELTSEWTRKGMGEYRKRPWQDTVPQHLQTLTYLFKGGLTSYLPPLSNNEDLF